MLFRPRTRLAWAACAFALVLAGCAPLSTRRIAHADRIVALSADRQLDCNRTDRCAQSSPFIAQAGRAIAASTPDHPRNTVTLLNIGQNALAARINLIRAARKSIDIQTYIWSKDDAGMLVLDELVKAARRGVKVRILADQLGSLNDPQLLSRLARASANLHIKLYNPTFDSARSNFVEYTASVLCCFKKFNQRMHNKLFLVDDEVGIVGGRNYANEYYDWDPQLDFLDRDVIVAGVAGLQMEKSFDLFWNNQRSIPLTHLKDVNADILAHPFDAEPWIEPRFADPQRVERIRAQAEDPGFLQTQLLDHSLDVGLVDYFYDLPSKDEAVHGPDSRELTRDLMKMLSDAHDQIVLQTPYLVLTRRAGKVFKALHAKRPPVDVIVSTNSLASTDALPVYALSYKHHKKYLVDFGFHIHELMPHPADAAAMLGDYYRLSGFGSEKSSAHHGGRAPIEPGSPGPRISLHAKSLVVDGRIGMVGSHNFDPRSADYNTEGGVIVDDPAFARQLRDAILRDAAPQNAWLVAPRRPIPIIGDVSQAIGDVSRSLPIFDIWPWAYATDYQLKPGGTPVPATAPDFLENWEPVGDFPQVNLSLTAIVTRFITAFGAGIQGIL
ncbi:MAG: Cardiolipin synthase phosphatidylethanolamine-utilizing, bacterial type ClsC [Rhodanobacteraceae bacterium]|jgi:phosphatidylserine/phosphatidylglycerophosphate/cardiolipin synthase-like enzyme|nr:MAG: Cardiolipin synthase phosphatidylethanolamine-utilizing, bacterial type ClsC [Rhodanobacteraceae bacterium]